MTPEEIDCPKCKGAMEKGKLMSPNFSKWIKGKPLTKFSVWKGDSVWTYRCKKCGYLESYI